LLPLFLNCLHLSLLSLYLRPVLFPSSIIRNLSFVPFFKILYKKCSHYSQSLSYFSLIHLDLFIDIVSLLQHLFLIPNICWKAHNWNLNVVDWFSFYVISSIISHICLIFLSIKIYFLPTLINFPFSFQTFGIL